MQCRDKGLTVCRDNRSDDANGQTTSCGSNKKKWNVSGTPSRGAFASEPFVRDFADVATSFVAESR